jgi:hypothetical protein
MRMFLLSLVFATAALNCLADQVPFAIVYGPKAAFNIAAPEGWWIDNSAGAENGIPCVLYRKGQTWDTADPLMYAKIARTSNEDAEAFAKTAITEMKKQRGKYDVKRVESGKTKGGESYFINEYSPTKTYPRTERVAYVQMPDAVAFVVYSADSKAVFRKHETALKQLLDSFMAMTVKREE